MTVPPLDKQCVAEVCVTAGGEAPLLIPPLDKLYLCEDIETAEYSDNALCALR